MRYLAIFSFIIILVISCGESDKERSAKLTDSVCDRMMSADGEGSNYPDSAEFKRDLADLTEAIRLDPENDFAHYVRGGYYLNTKEYYKALSDYDSALKSENNHNSPLYHRFRGEANYRLGNYREAISDLTCYIENYTWTSDAMILRAKAKWKLGLFDKACADYKKAIEEDSTLSKQKEFIDCE